MIEPHRGGSAAGRYVLRNRAQSEGHSRGVPLDVVLGRLRHDLEDAVRRCQDLLDRQVDLAQLLGRPVELPQISEIGDEAADRERPCHHPRRRDDHDGEGAGKYAQIDDGRVAGLKLGGRDARTEQFVGSLGEPSRLVAFSAVRLHNPDPADRLRGKRRELPDQRADTPGVLLRRPLEEEHGDYQRGHRRKDEQREPCVDRVKECERSGEDGNFRGHVLHERAEQSVDGIDIRRDAAEELARAAPFEERQRHALEVIVEVAPEGMYESLVRQFVQIFLREPAHFLSDEDAGEQQRDEGQGRQVPVPDHAIEQHEAHHPRHGEFQQCAGGDGGEQTRKQRPHAPGIGQQAHQAALHVRRRQRETVVLQPGAQIQAGPVPGHRTSRSTRSSSRT